MKDVKFFYSAGAMGYYGEGYRWHRFFKFPKLPLVTKTLTLLGKSGLPYAVFPIGNSVYNKVMLHNIGITKWLDTTPKQYYKDLTVSIAGSDTFIESMCIMLDSITEIKAIELNFSCPNVKEYLNQKLPILTNKKLYLKLNHKQEPYDYDLDRISGIRLNSIKKYGMAASGEVAKEKNWKFIRKFNREGLNIAGCSFNSMEDIRKLIDMGCKEIGIGSVILTSPGLVHEIGNIKGE